ncbi:MAG: type II toxin-antitoxin system HicB family antitoxin [Isosphaeraceae bacterium]
MTSTLNIPFQIVAGVHEVEGGGYWAEVRRLPGCLAPAETLDALKGNLV